MIIYGGRETGPNSRNSKREAIKQDQAEGRGFESHQWNLFEKEIYSSSQGPYDIHMRKWPIDKTAPS